MKKQRPAGLTIVEILVVIAIIAVLMSLILPALGGAREAGRRVACQNNLRQLGIALQNFDGTNRRLPGFMNNAGGAADRLAGWPILLFPQIEQDAAWSRWNDPDSAADVNPLPPVATLVCPSDPPYDSTAANLSYVANCGTAILAKIPVPKGAGMKAADGVFVNRYNRAVYVSPLTTWTVSLRRIPDGTSQTIMLSENIQAGEYSSTRYFSPAPVDSDAAVPLLSDAQILTGMVWDWDPAVASSPPKDERRINGKKWFGPTAPVTTYYYSRPSSFHPGGVYAVFCDSSVVWLREDIEYKVYEQLMTSDGARSNMQGPPTDQNAPINYVLRDEDYR